MSDLNLFCEPLEDSYPNPCTLARELMVAVWEDCDPIDFLENVAKFIGYGLAEAVAHLTFPLLDIDADPGEAWTLAVDDGDAEDALTLFGD